MPTFRLCEFSVWRKPASFRSRIDRTEKPDFPGNLPSPHLTSQAGCPFFCVLEVPPACFNDGISIPGCFPLGFNTPFPKSTELYGLFVHRDHFLCTSISISHKEVLGLCLGRKQFIGQEISGSIAEKQEMRAVRWERAARVCGSMQTSADGMQTPECIIGKHPWVWHLS